MTPTLNGTVRVEHVMGMPVVVDVRDDVGSATLDEVFEWLEHVDAVFSTYREDSDVSRLDRGESTLDEVESDVREVLERCDALKVETRGFFDVRAAGRRNLDPSGLVKGWSVDRAARLLDRAGCANYAVNAGGDIRLRGGALPDDTWRVGIQHPLDRERLAAVVAASDLAVATSGAYARGDHVFDPHTGRPAEGLLSVTVTGADLATADAFATAAFAMGEAGSEWIRDLPRRGYEALAITADQRVLTTPGFPLADR